MIGEEGMPAIPDPFLADKCGPVLELGQHEKGRHLRVAVDMGTLTDQMPRRTTINGLDGRVGNTQVVQGYVAHYLALHSSSSR